jgi:hypothetical protein
MSVVKYAAGQLPRNRSKSMKMGCAVSIQPQWDLCGLLSDV